MEENRTNNYVMLRGVMSEPPVFSHESREERFYQFSLEISRLSGVADTVHIVARQQLLAALTPEGEQKICVIGELRSFNNKSGSGPKLIITVYAKEISLCGGEDENVIELTGAICKQPNLRTTPMGREICDLMLAVNRKYGRSDYLPCIAWGSSAREASAWTPGTIIRLTGRLQSRVYTKMTDGGAVEKVAYEVSALHVSAE